jgi:hypothetical protein
VDRKHGEMKLAAAIAALQPALAAVFEATYALGPGYKDDRIMQLGYITDATSLASSRTVRILAYLLDMLLTLEEHAKAPY